MNSSLPLAGSREDQTRPLDAAARRTAFGRILRVTSGNFLEMYDFMVYAYYASYISRTFFPSGNEFASLMLTLMTFGAGYLMRPLGAIVLGAYIDRHGRRKGLMLTLALMAVGTLLIALLPGYAAIGLAAPLLVVLGRLLQGFSAGVELGGVSIYLAEIATPGNKGFYCAWQSGSQQVAVMFAAALGVLLSFLLPPESMALWGWRVPFLIGCLIVPLLFMLRRSLEETEAFKAQKHRPTLGEAVASIGRNWRLVLAGMLLATMTTVSFYFITAYTPTFGVRELHLSAFDALLVTVCVGLSNFIWLPIGGAISDRVGRRPVIIACVILALVSAYPVLAWLAAAPSFARLLEVELWLSFIYGIYNGGMIPYLTEIMPASVRTTGFSLAYSLATAIFGGFTPAVATWLIHSTGNAATPGLWLSAAAACGLLAILMTRGLAPDQSMRRSA